MNKLIFSLAVSFSIMSCDSSPKVIDTLENEQINSLLEKDTAYEALIEDLNALQSVFNDDPILRAKFSEYTYSDFLTYKRLFDDSLKVVELSNYASLKEEHYLDSIHLVFKDTTDQLIEKLIGGSPFNFVKIDLVNYKYSESSYSRWSERTKSCEFFFDVKSDSSLLGIKFYYEIYKKNTKYTWLPIGDYFEIGKKDRLYVSEGIDQSDLRRYTLEHLKKDKKPLGKTFRASSYESYYYGKEDEYSTIEFDIPNLYGDDLSMRGFRSADFKIEFPSMTVITSTGNYFSYPSHHYRSLDSLGLEREYNEEQYQYIFEDVFSIPRAFDVWYSAFKSKRLQIQKEFSELGFELEELISSKSNNDSRLEDLLRLLAD